MCGFPDELNLVLKNKTDVYEYCKEDFAFLAHFKCQLQSLIMKK